MCVEVQVEAAEFMHGGDAHEVGFCLEGVDRAVCSCGVRWCGDEVNFEVGLREDQASPFALLRVAFALGSCD